MFPHTGNLRVEGPIALKVDRLNPLGVMERPALGRPLWCTLTTSIPTSGMHYEVALDALLEHPTARLGYPASVYACKTIGGPFFEGTGGENLNYACRAAFTIS